MKKITYLLTSMIVGAGLLVSCSDFDEINVNPKAVSADQVQVEYFLNNSMVGAQMDPHIAERVFVLYWKQGGHQDLTGGGLAVASPNDGWTSDYYGTGYLAGWIKNATLAVQIADQQLESGAAFAHVNNLKQCARIWRAYLYSEICDNFGPGALNKELGVIPDFASQEECYKFMLSELKDAVNQIDPSIPFSGNASTDHVYGYNFNKWIKYGNSMRMRLAMRISNSDASYAKTEFEDAARGSYISDLADSFQMIEQGGWDALTAVMSREWNLQYLSATLNNLMIGLGGITTEASIGSKYPIADAIKPANYFGVRYDKHFSLMSNDPTRGFWFDGLYNVIDPRAYEMYYIPGNNDTQVGKNYDPNYCYYPSWTNDARTQKRKLIKQSGDGSYVTPLKEDLTIDGTYTWNAFTNGDWGKPGSLNELRGDNGMMPCLRNHFRNGTNKRVFFGSWESYFLIAEAAEKGWTVPMSGKAAYEAGVRASFEYNNQSAFVDAYLQSQDYNRVGTSVAWDHTVEAGAIDYVAVDGYTGEAITHTWTKPANTIYGSNNNDHMNKILTQKFIAQTPWLPSETWSDHRRLGLPFFENPAVENPIQTLPDLNASNCQTMNKTSFFPQRLKYPSGLANSNPEGYAKAVQLLGGPDESLTPLWWAKK